MFEQNNDCIVMAENLTKIYGSGSAAVRALDGVNLEVRAGEFLAVVGASGSGKSTLLHMIGAMDRPTSGKITVDGTNIVGADSSELAVFRRRKTGFVFQLFSLVTAMSVRENILLPLMLDGQKPDLLHFDEIASALGLTELLDKYPHTLSGGQQQRASIARALMSKPPVILADEPTGNLDTHNSREIIAILKSTIARYGQTLILITHDPSVAAEADRIVRLSDGRVTGV